MVVLIREETRVPADHEWDCDDIAVSLDGETVLIQQRNDGHDEPLPLVDMLVIDCRDEGVGLRALIDALTFVEGRLAAAEAVAAVG